MALFGGGVMIGPILGPVLGGWLTDNYNWRWVFLVNLPVGIVCALVMLRFMPKTETHQRKFDMFGFALLAIALGALQLFLDRGQQEDSLSSWEIRVELGIAIAAAWMFVVHMITASIPLFDHRCSRSKFLDGHIVHGVDRRPAACRSRVAAAAAPEFVRRSVLRSGFLTARRRGVATLISMLLAGRLRAVRRPVTCRHRRDVDGRVLVDDDRLCDRPAVKPGHRQRRRSGPRPRPDLRASSEPRVRNACTEDAGPPPPPC